MDKLLTDGGTRVKLITRGELRVIALTVEK